MSLPANITQEITNLQAQITAASPLASASRATVYAIKLNAGQLVADSDTALAAAAGALDTWQAPVDPTPIINGILGLSTSAALQSSLASCRGFVGRAASNLNQLPT